LDLLQKFKTLKDSGGKVADEARKKLEQTEALLKVCGLHTRNNSLIPLLLSATG
jgi:hypothetical protein